MLGNSQVGKRFKAVPAGRGCWSWRWQGVCDPADQPPGGGQQGALHASEPIHDCHENSHGRGEGRGARGSVLINSLLSRCQLSCPGRGEGTALSALTGCSSLGQQRSHLKGCHARLVDHARLCCRRPSASLCQGKSPHINPFVAWLAAERLTVCCSCVGVAFRLHQAPKQARRQHLQTRYVRHCSPWRFCLTI